MNKNLQISFFLFGLLTITSQAAMTANDQRDLTQTIDAMINRIDTSGCEPIKAEKWVRLLLMGEPIQHTLHFAKGCDLEGDVRITKQPFPFDLKVAHISGVRRIKGVVETAVQPHILDQEFEIKVNARHGKIFDLQDKVSAQWTLQYDLVTNMTGQVQSNKGGKIEVQKFRNQVPIKKNFPFLIGKKAP